MAGIPIVDAGTPLEALGLSREFSVWPAYHKLGIPHAIPECHARGEVFERLLRVAAALPGGVRLWCWTPGGRSPCSSISTTACPAPWPRTTHGPARPSWNSSPASSSRRRAAAARRPAHISPAARWTSPCATPRAAGWTWAAPSTKAVPASYTAYFERLAEPDTRQRRVRDHRRLLYHAMLDAGFSNLPSEWWHYDFGDQLWAWHTGATQALFGSAVAGDGRSGASSCRSARRRTRRRRRAGSPAAAGRTRRRTAGATTPPNRSRPARRSPAPNARWFPAGAGPGPGVRPAATG